jgi:hypothetical protein
MFRGQEVFTKLIEKVTTAHVAAADGAAKAHLPSRPHTRLPPLLARLPPLLARLPPALARLPPLLARLPPARPPTTCSPAYHLLARLPPDHVGFSPSRPSLATLPLRLTRVV